MDLATIEQQIATAIGQQETGGGTTGVGVSLNNTGALKFASWETAYGATPTSSGFAQFPNQAAGTSALTALIDKYIQSGSSIASLIGSWSPVSDGNSNNPARISQISNVTGLNPSQPINTQTSTPSSFTGLMMQMGSLAGASASAVVNAATGASTTAPATTDQGNILGVSWSRLAAFLCGLGAITIGLLMLKQTQVVVQNVAEKAATTAKIAAL